MKLYETSTASVDEFDVEDCEPLHLPLLSHAAADDAVALEKMKQTLTERDITHLLWTTRSTYHRSLTFMEAFVKR